MGWVVVVVVGQPITDPISGPSLSFVFCLLALSLTIIAISLGDCLKFSLVFHMFFLCRQFFDKKEKQIWLEKTWRSCNLETKSWFNKVFIYYSNYSNSNIRIVLFGIRYSIIFKNRIYSVFGIRSFLKNRIYSVFGIRPILTIRENTVM